MKKMLLMFAGIAMLMGTGCSRKAENEADNLKAVQTADHAMSAAITKARESSADFLRAFHEQQPDTKDFMSKSLMRLLPKPTNTCGSKSQRKKMASSQA